MKYQINDESREISADIDRLSNKDITRLQKYQLLGYKIINKKEPTKEPKEEFKKEVIIKFLEDKPEHLKKYWELYNEPSISKKTNKVRKTKEGKIIPKGHIATLSWFKKEFPKYPEKK